MMIPRSAAVVVGFWFAFAEAVYYKIDTPDAIRQSASTLAYDAMLFYHGNETGQIIGILPGPPASGTGDYYWYQGGAMMGTYIDYWHYTGDTTYNNVVIQAMQFQVGENKNYEPQNWTASLGNDDQAFWGMSAMLAAENKFPNPPADKPQWLELAQAVWNRQALPERHDHYCGGGMRWQIPSVNNGWDYKNTIANACFMNIGARLARYTGNSSYADSASQTWDWMWSKNYIDHDTWSVYDGGHVKHDCKDVAKTTFTANGAVLIQAVAYLYNFTNGDAVWENRLDKLLDRFLINNFKNGVSYEPNCEPNKGCNSDMLWFKGYAHRWLSVVSQIAPNTADKILPVLKTSAEAAVNQCTGAPTGRKCGFFWSSGQFVDPSVTKTSGAGEAINVLAAVSSLLVDQTKAPVTTKSGGISKGNPSAGLGGHEPRKFKPVTTADKAGAGILTVLIAGGITYMFVWLTL